MIDHTHLLSRFGISFPDFSRILAIKRESETATLPARATPGAIGYDVYADIPDFQAFPMRIMAGARKLVPLGFSMACPPGTYGRLAPRSGLALKQGVHVMAGVIDPDYRGVVHVLLLNTSGQIVEIKHADRVAQLILECAMRVSMCEVQVLPDTARGEGGFGSTG